MRRRLAAPLALSLMLLSTQPSLAQEQPRDCAPKDIDALSNWNGVWIAENLQADINGREAPGAPTFAAGMKLGGLGGPWNEEGWRQVEAASMRFNSGALVAGWGFPMMMSAPAPFKFVVSPSETAVISQYQDIRYVYTDGRGHLPEDERWPTVWGDSIGCWEGDTLVIETVAIRYSPEYNGMAPPLSEEARVVERIRLTAPDRLEADFTITDPVMLEHPWTVHMVYLRHPVLDRLVHEGTMFDNNRTVAQDGLTTIADLEQEPTQTKLAPEPVRLSVAELDRVVGTYSLEGAPLEFIFERRGERMFYRVDPPLPWFLRLRALSPLDYAFANVTFRFTIDSDGQVTGFTGTAPDGSPMKAFRKTTPLRTEAVVDLRP